MNSDPETGCPLMNRFHTTILSNVKRSARRNSLPRYCHPFKYGEIPREF